LKVEPFQLQIEGAALLAGLLKSPTRYSPTRHPDRALQRRNEITDAMVQASDIGEAEGPVDKARPLLLD
jgi:penicillin-binding protein 1A